MGIGSGIDRLLRTLRTPADAGGPAVSDPVTGLPFPTGTGNGSADAAEDGQDVPSAQDATPPEEASATSPAEIAAPAPRPVETLNAWVDAAYRAHREAVGETTPDGAKVTEPRPAPETETEPEPESHEHPGRASMRESPIAELFRATTAPRRDSATDDSATPADVSAYAPQNVEEALTGSKSAGESSDVPEWSPADVPEWAPPDGAAPEEPGAAGGDDTEDDGIGELGEPSTPESGELVHETATAEDETLEPTGAGEASLAIPEETDPAAPPLPAGLHVDALARLEAASGVAESLGLGFHLGAAVERIAYGASRGRDGVEALREAAWLIDRYVALVEQRPLGADLHASSVRLGRTGDAIVELRALTAELELRRAVREALVDAGSGRLDVEHADEQPEAATAQARDSEPVAVDAPREPDPAVPPAVAQERESFGREVALMAIRWAIMVVAVVAVVLAVTLIGDWL